MSGHNLMKDTIESRALETLAHYFPEFKKLIKTERPDWTSVDRQIGLETTSPDLACQKRAFRGFTEFRNKTFDWAMRHESRMNELHTDFYFINEKHDMVVYESETRQIHHTVVENDDFVNPIFCDYVSYEDVPNPENYRFITCAHGLVDTSSFNKIILKTIQTKMNRYQSTDSAAHMTLHVDIMTCFEEEELISNVQDMMIDRHCPFERVILEFHDRFVIISRLSGSVGIMYKSTSSDAT